MNIYTKSKTTVSSVDIVKNRVVDENTSMKVSFNPENVNLIIEYLTNLYANAPVAVVRELFTNACDADPNGFVNIDIKEDSNGAYTFTITDNGTGMNKQQLTENYVQYANSTKTSEFDSVGSFGLGSKSPMAISSEYEVESCDGDKIHRAIVQRIESGIYANIDEIGESSKTYTKVIVSGISKTNIERMQEFVQYLANFSGRSIIFNNDILKRTEKYSLSINVPSDVYDITIFTDKNSEDKFKMNMFTSYYRNGGKNFNTIIRVNNTPYTVQRTEDKCYGTIVIDVEPGYFSFAPSREEIPGGEKKEHILEIANNCVFENIKEYVSFISENEFVEDEVIFNSFLEKDMFREENDIDKLANVTCETINKYKDIWNVKNQTEKAKDKFKKLFGDCGISFYCKSSFKHVKLDSIREFVDTDNLLYIVSERMNNPIKRFSTDSVNSLEYVKLHTNAKKTRKGKYVNPHGYGRMSIAEEIKNFASFNNLFGRVCDYYSTWRTATITAVHIITESEGLSDEALEYLKIINIKSDDCNDPVNAEVIAEPFNYEVKEKVKKEKVSYQERNIRYRTGQYPSNTFVKVSEIPNKFSSDEYVIVNDKNLLGNKNLPYLSYKCGKKFIHFEYYTKTFQNYISDNNYDYLEIEFKKDANSNTYCWFANNDFSKQFLEFLNCDNKTQYIIQNEHDLVMSYVASYSCQNEFFYKYLNVNIQDISSDLKIFLNSHINKYDSKASYNVEFIDSFNAKKFFKDNKSDLVNKEKYRITRFLHSVFGEYFPVGEYKEIDFPHDEWKSQVMNMVLEDKELGDFKEKLSKFKSLKFYEFSSTIASGLNLDNPIHKVIKDTMDSELKEFFA